MVIDMVTTASSVLVEGLIHTSARHGRWAAARLPPRYTPLCRPDGGRHAASNCAKVLSSQSACSAQPWLIRRILATLASRRACDCLASGAQVDASAVSLAAQRWGATLFDTCDFEYRHASGITGRVRADELWCAAERTRGDAGDMLGLGVVLRCLSQSNCRHPSGWTLVGLPGQDARTSRTGLPHTRPPETDLKDFETSTGARLSAVPSPHDDFSGREDEDVVLRTMGVVFDAGLCAQGLPPESWHAHALGALGDELRAGDGGFCTAVLREEDWDSPSAEDVVGVIEATAGMLVQVAERGAEFFAALTLAEREVLRDAAGAIARVSQASSRLRRI